MKNFEEHLKSHTDSIRLSTDEKDALRQALRARMQEQPLPPLVSPWMDLLRMPQMMAFAVAVLCIVGGGSTYAAQGALPGDILYPVKIHVNEQVEVALAREPLEQVQVQTHIADRRIEEAETLARRGTLTPATAEALEANFTVHATQAIALSQSIPGPLALAPTTSLKKMVPVAETEDIETPNAEDASDNVATMRTATTFSLTATEETPAPVLLKKAVVTEPEEPSIEVPSDTELTASLKASFMMRASIFMHLRQQHDEDKATSTPPVKVPMKKPYSPPQTNSTEPSKVSETAESDSSVDSMATSTEEASSTEEESESSTSHEHSHASDSDSSSKTHDTPSVSSTIKNILKGL